MRKIIFAGPTLNIYDLEKIDLSTDTQKFNNIQQLENTKSSDSLFLLPPVAGGDLYNLPEQKEPDLIIIIDGYFENKLSVWHKEILHSLNEGNIIIGCSSMGALRAAELDVFGMNGYGLVYDLFRNGFLEDDDEVTVSHGPAELGYPQISEAMINIRFTLDHALKNKIITEKQKANIIHVAKSTFYKKRNYGYILRQCVEDGYCSEKDFSRLHLWLQKYRIDQKKNDALNLIKSVADNNGAGYIFQKETEFTFNDTFLWRQSLEAIA